MHYRTLLLTLFLCIFAYADDDIADIVGDMGRSDNKTIDWAEDIKTSIMESLKIEGKKHRADILKEYDVYNNPDIDDAAEALAASDGKKLLFISASIPVKVLQNYIKDAAGDVIFILRGPVGTDPSKIKPTQEFIVKLLCDKSIAELTVNAACQDARIDINPIMFKIFDVKTVPTFVLTDKSYETIQDSEAGGNYAKIAGTVSIEYAYEKLTEAVKKIK